MKTLVHGLVLNKESKFVFNDNGFGLDNFFAEAGPDVREAVVIWEQAAFELFLRSLEYDFLVQWFGPLLMSNRDFRTEASFLKIRLWACPGSR